MIKGSDESLPFFISFELSISVLRRAAYFTYINIAMKDKTVIVEELFAATAAVAYRMAAVCTDVKLIFGVLRIG